MADIVNINPPTNAVVTTAGVAVPVIPAQAKGGWITNPPGASASLFINPLMAGGIAAGGNNGTDFELQPGATWLIVPLQNSITWANAPDNGHVFSAIFWL